MFKMIKDAAFWKNAATDPHYAELRNQVQALFEKSRMETIEAQSFDDRIRYYRTGDRSVFERPYFRRRNSLSAAAILAMLSPENESYLQYVQNMIWAICDEYSWVVPAHAKGTVQADVDHIDLFSAETAACLAEICYILGERLDPLVRQRIHYEIERRILSSFRSRIIPFEHTTNNWLSVCGCCVAVSMMYERPQEFEALIPRFLLIMQRFLDSFSDEGVCPEGISYWCYGFVNFTWFADMLYRFTNGKYDLFDNEKVKRIASYAQKCFMKGNASLSFSDGTRKAAIFDSLLYYLSKRYPDAVHLLPKELSLSITGNVIWMNLLRAFVFRASADAPRYLSLENYDFPNAGHVIVNQARYSLFVKAGNNDEPHNHNDVGSFIIATESGQVFCDLGGGLYTKQYFEGGMDRRYAILCNSSFGHSVPIVNKRPQQCGKQYCGTILHTDNRITAEIANAYDVSHLKALTREFTYLENEILLCDRYTKGVRLTDRFVTLYEPAVEDGCVRVADMTLRFDPEKLALTIKTERHEQHAPGNFETVYCLDFEPLSDTGEMCFRFVIED